jgi:hypothetical protein
MLSHDALRELRTCWLPNLTADGLDRLIDLLEKGSPLLIHGCFTRAVPMGCLASHAAWHHPATAHLTVEAGISWLHSVAGLNPATSHLVREWDACGQHDWQLRLELAAYLKEERQRRQHQPCNTSRLPDLVGV